MIIDGGGCAAKDIWLEIQGSVAVHEVLGDRIRHVCRWPVGVAGNVVEVGECVSVDTGSIIVVARGVPKVAPKFVLAVIHSVSPFLDTRRFPELDARQSCQQR